MITETKLKELGFRETTLNGEKCFYIQLRRNQDRRPHSVRWYADEPETFYIDCIYLWGVETILEEQFLLNRNNLANSAVQHYNEIMEKLNQDMGR